MGLKNAPSIQRRTSFGAFIVIEVEIEEKERERERAQDGNLYGKIPDSHKINKKPKPQWVISNFFCGKRD